ncbi:MAG: hypothetical protein KIH62_002435 [Candidatus Kerfeldbacteria bacterium]|nr:hypothetical protein [Candidatus Kerfeldbacteria bacterium]
MAKHTASKFLVGATVLGTAAAGIITFFTKTPKGKKIWKDSVEHGVALLSMVSQKAAKMKHITAASYNRLVDEVMEEYQQHRQLTEETARTMNAALKKEWKTIQRGIQASVQPSKKGVKK